MAAAVERRVQTLGLKRVHSMTSNEADSEEEFQEDHTWPIGSDRCPARLFDDLSKRPRLKVQCKANQYMSTFLQLLDDDIIQDFLWVDGCAKLADKYLLAMVYVYFRRACLPLHDFNRLNFFIALYLANDIEEDEEDEKYEIFPWAIGDGWMSQFPKFLTQRDALWRKMGFRAVVSRRTCEEVIAMAPHNSAWLRERQPHHGGAVRSYLKLNSPRYGRNSPLYCPHCAQLNPSPLVVSPITLLPKRDLLDDIDGLLDHELLAMAASTHEE